MTDTATENTKTTVPDSYAETKEQLDEIVAQVRKKDVSLEKSLDLLEEGVALANRATELIDQAAWEAIESETTDGEQDADEADPEAGATPGDSTEETLDADIAADTEVAAEDSKEDVAADSADDTDIALEETN